MFLFGGKILKFLFHPMITCTTGSAVGFKLDSLLKLSDTRARNNKMTLMHYLCKVELYLCFYFFYMHLSLSIINSPQTGTNRYNYIPMILFNLK